MCRANFCATRPKSAPFGGQLVNKSHLSNRPHKSGGSYKENLPRWMHYQIRHRMEHRWTRSHACAVWSPRASRHRVYSLKSTSLAEALLKPEVRLSVAGCALSRRQRRTPRWVSFCDWLLPRHSSLSPAKDGGVHLVLSNCEKPISLVVLYDATKLVIRDSTARSLHVQFPPQIDFLE